MIKFFTNRKLSKQLGINLAKWKRWSREFLPPDPLGGMQSGYARQYHPNQAFTVFLGGHLVGDLKFAIPEARQIMRDLEQWLSDKGFFYEPKGYVVSGKGVDGLVQKYIIFIRRETGSNNHFKFICTARGIISNDPILHKGFEIMKKLYVETPINSGTENAAKSDMNVVKPLYITGLLNDFVDAMGLDRTRYPALLK
ncbi:MAG: hypothetical protein P8012_07320 [Desulfobacterales bacterium]